MGKTLNITIEGLDELLKNLGDFGGSILQSHLELAVMRIYARLNARLSEYPSPPEGSKYVRTWDLSQGWQTAQMDFMVFNGTAFDFQSQESNDVDYSGYLQDLPELRRVMAYQRQRKTGTRHNLRAESGQFRSRADSFGAWIPHTAQNILQSDDMLDFMGQVLEEEINQAIKDAGL